MQHYSKVFHDKFGRELYNYRSYLQTLLSYGSDAATSHLTNRYWYLDRRNMLPCDPTATYTDEKNKGFIARWNRIKQNKEVDLYGRLHTDIRNVPTHLTFWRRTFFQILAHPVFKMWVIKKPNKVALWNKRHFEGGKNGDYTSCLKYSVRTFVE